MKEKTNLDAANNCNLAKNLIFIDGITRCGKSVFSSIISSFEDMEHIQFYNLIELVIPSVKLSGVNEKFARNILRSSFNELAYNIQISRNVNFRKNDQTSIYKYKEPSIYINRLDIDEGDSVVENILNNDFHLPLQTHDLMVNLDVVDLMELDYKIIELYRNPIDNIYSWWARGFGERFASDPREFTLLIEHADKKFPWYVLGYEEKIADLNPYERCVMMGVDLIERSIKQQKYAKFPEKILTINFEDMVQNPKNQIKRLEKFLGKNKTQYTETFISEANCPRVLDYEDRKNKLQIFEDNVNSELFASLVSLTDSYEKDVYGLQ